ncbi:MAG: hypothetical protein RLZZ337_2011, partial [Bacteroidota bacterium]
MKISQLYFGVMLFASLFQACTTDDVQPIGGSGAAIVSISVDKSAIFEDAGKAVLTASLSTNTTEDVTISLRFTGTATISADYS